MGRTQTEHRAERLVVLGATGFLGPHLIAAAARPGSERELLAVARTEPAAALDGARFVSVDIACRTALVEFFEATRPSVVLNAAACSRGADCERDPVLAERINSLAAGELAGLAAEHCVRLVHISTDLVHGATPPPAGGFADDAAAAPQGVYGATKACGEAAVLERCPEALVVRLPLLFGESHGRGLGASDSLFAGLAAGRRTVVFDDEFRQPLEAGAAARALLELAQTDASGRLNLPGPERLSRAAFAARLLEARAASGAAPLPQPEVGPRAVLGLDATRPADTQLSGARAASLLRRPLPRLDEQIFAALRVRADPAP